MSSSPTVLQLLGSSSILLVVILPFAIFISLLVHAEASPTQKTIIGYYASWQYYDRSGLAKPKHLDFSKVSRVNFAFFHPDAQGNLYGTDSWGDPLVLFGPYDWNPAPNSPTYCHRGSGPGETSCNHHTYSEGLIHLAHSAGAEVWPSLGGWTLSDNFPAIAASETTRRHFAEECVSLLRDYNFDGIDIDWEYPGYVAHSGTKDDRENYNLLLSEVRAQLDAYTLETGKHYGLTAALPCGPDNIANLDIPFLENVLTEHNLMTYDFHGPWDQVTGMNSPLFYQGFGSYDYSTHQCVTNWIDAGASSSKINVGIPFYGRSFAGAKGLNAPHTGVDDIHWGEDNEGNPLYYQIVNKLPLMTQMRHEESSTPYAYFSNEGGFLSYDDEQSICEKTEYVLDHGLNGLLIWELSGDVMTDLSTPLLDTMNRKLAFPSTSCDGSDSDLSSNNITAAPTLSMPLSSGCSTEIGDESCNSHGISVCVPTQFGDDSIEDGCWIPKWDWPNDYCEYRHSQPCEDWEKMQGGDSWDSCCMRNDHCRGSGLQDPSGIATSVCTCECFEGWSGPDCDLCYSDGSNPVIATVVPTTIPTLTPTVAMTQKATMYSTSETTTGSTEEMNENDDNDDDRCNTMCHSTVDGANSVWYLGLVDSWCQIDCTRLVTFFPSRCVTGCRTLVESSSSTTTSLRRN